MTGRPFRFILGPDIRLGRTGMSSITTGNAEQYADSQKLAARARLNSHYTIAESGLFEWVARHLPLAPGADVLDIGCGPGWFWAATAASLPSDLHLTLADQSAGMIAEALERCRPLPLGSVQAREADAMALPFADASFDGVIAMHMLYHVADQPKAIAEMARVLKPGGFLAVTTNGAGNTAALYELATVFGSPPQDPSSLAFGYDRAEALLRDQFDAVERLDYPARLRITSAEDVFLALTSYPPGDGADAGQLTQFRTAIQAAFAAGGGVLETDKQVALFLARKPG